MEMKKGPQRPTGYVLFCRLRAAVKAEISSAEIACRAADGALRVADGEPEESLAAQDVAATGAMRRTWVKADIVLKRIYAEWSDEDLRALRAGFPILDRGKDDGEG